MRHQAFIPNEEKLRWFEIEVTIGTNETWIAKETRELTKFLKSFEDLERSEFKELTGIDIASISAIEVSDQLSLRLLMMKKFIDGIGLNILRESRVGIGQTEPQIYLSLLKDLVESNKLPEDIYVYSVYRQRGTPTTWLTVSGELTADETEEKLTQNARRIIRYINRNLPYSRKLKATVNVQDLVILLLTKPTQPRVIKAETNNVEVSGASYSLIILDKTNNKIGVVSGAKREVFHIQHYLRNFIYKDVIAIPRTDVVEDGNELLVKIISPSDNDSLILQSVELKNTTLPEGPSLRLQVDGTKSISDAISVLRVYWQSLTVNELRRADFLLGGKKVGLYTYGDEWKRTFINTATKNTTSRLEYEFIELVKERLDGNSIKETRFLLGELDMKFILDKLFRDKVVSTDPPIPEVAEKTVIDLISKGLIKKQSPTIKRKCMSCFSVSWDSWECPSCDRSNMQIVSEAIKIEVRETMLMKTISRMADLGIDREAKYYPRKQRNRNLKSVTGIFNKPRNIHTFIVFVSRKNDIKFVESLISEGFGVVVVVEPRMEGVSDYLESLDSSVLKLTVLTEYLLNNQLPNPLVASIQNQENRMLERIFARTNESITALNEKRNYNEDKFEVDLKNLLQALVPDVIRLGTEQKGISVPDGYLRYGSDGSRSSRKGRRLFGWDAKYSTSGTYSLSERDVTTQKKYIRWLMDSNGDARQFGTLGIYAIISNFSSTTRMNNVLLKLANYRKLKSSTRIALIEDLLIVRISEWLLIHWEQVLENNSLIADVVFKWLRRRQSSRPYTVSKASDWPRLEARLNQILQS